MSCDSTQCLSARGGGHRHQVPQSRSGVVTLGLQFSASPPGGAVKSGRLKPLPAARLSNDGRSGLESSPGAVAVAADPTGGACSHTKPGFMDDLKHLGHPFVPLVCRHLRRGSGRSSTVVLRPPQHAVSHKYTHQGKNNLEKILNFDTHIEV